MSTINKVLDIEHRMFMSVNAVGDPPCRRDADMFRLHRSAQFSAWAEDTLQSYYDDLQTAEACGRNLMTYKYARMDDLIPAENDSPLIGKISAIQIEWQQKMFEDYPVLMKNARGVVSNENSPLSVSFKTYLAAELESYSKRTLELLYRDVMNYKNSGINMSERIYEVLVDKQGYGPLERFRADA